MIHYLQVSYSSSYENKTSRRGEENSVPHRNCLIAINYSLQLSVLFVFTKIHKQKTNKNLF